MGRKTLSAGEMRRMIHAENIQRAYYARSKGNAAEWVKDNPEMNKLLFEAQKITEVEDA